MRDQPRCSRALALEASPAFVDSVCIVTGASAGIGAALCEALACELKVSVVAVARRADRLEALRERLGERIICVVGDVTDPATITKALDACASPPFALINNAGVARDGAVVLGGSESAINETFAINTVAPALIAGNTVLLKHATQTLLVGERMARAFVEAGVPADVFQNVFLDHDTTSTLIAAKSFGFVNFTGSVGGGRAIETAAAGTFTGDAFAAHDFSAAATAPAAAAAPTQARVACG